MPMDNREKQTNRYWELQHAIDKARAKIAPLREAHDRFVNDAADKARQLAAKMHAAEENVLHGMSLNEALDEVAFLARGLVNVGEDPSKK